jgi:hypothetical protein
MLEALIIIAIVVGVSAYFTVGMYADGRLGSPNEYDPMLVFLWPVSVPCMLAQSLGESHRRAEEAKAWKRRGDDLAVFHDEEDS